MGADAELHQAVAGGVPAGAVQGDDRHPAEVRVAAADRQGPGDQGHGEHGQRCMPAPVQRRAGHGEDQQDRDRDVVDGADDERVARPVDHEHRRQEHGGRQGRVRGAGPAGEGALEPSGLVSGHRLTISGRGARSSLRRIGLRPQTGSAPAGGRPPPVARGSANPSAGGRPRRLRRPRWGRRHQGRTRRPDGTSEGSTSCIASPDVSATPAPAGHGRPSGPGWSPPPSSWAWRAPPEAGSPTTSSPR
jgi:hypothetical protein